MGIITLFFPFVRHFSQLGMDLVKENFHRYVRGPCAEAGQNGVQAWEGGTDGEGEFPRYLLGLPTWQILPIWIHKGWLGLNFWGVYEVILAFSSSCCLCSALGDLFVRAFQVFSISSTLNLAFLSTCGLTTLVIRPRKAFTTWFEDKPQYCMIALITLNLLIFLFIA